METSIKIEPIIFTLNKADLPILLKRFGLVPTALSPFAKELSQEHLVASALSAEEQNALEQDPDFWAMMQILAKPERVIRVYAGGGMQARGDVFMCIQPLAQPFPMVAITPSFENSWVTLAFPDVSQGTAWLLETLSSDVSEAPKSPLPASFSVEFLCYIFGAIDQFRRCSYENLLRYKADELPTFTLSAFAQNMHEAIQAADIRWALPAFVAFAPGLQDLKLSADPVVFNELVESDIALPISDKDGVLTFSFGEIGKDLGIEFYRTWAKSAGIEVLDATSNGTSVRHRCYLANTMWANHFFELLRDQNGRGSVRYAPFSRQDLGAILENWITAPTEPIIELPSANSEAPVMVSISDGNCAACGYPLLPNAQFCSHCGAVQAKKDLCPHCGASVKLNQKFCTKCGTRI